MSNFDVFSMYGFPMPEQKKAEPKKEVKKEKPKKAATKKTEKKAKAPAEEKVTLPATVYSGQKFVFEAEGDEKELTTADFKKKVSAACQIPEKVLALKKEKDVYVASVDRSKAVAKGKVKLTPETKVTMLGENIDISSLVSTEMVDVADISDFARENISQVLHCVQMVEVDADHFEMTCSNLAAPTKEEIGNLKFPFLIGAVGTGDLSARQITKEVYAQFLKEELKETVTEVKVFAENLKQFANKLYPDFGGFGEIGVVADKDTNLVFIYTDVVNKAATSAPKVEKIPTEGVEISLVFKKIPVTPEMFGGKTEATKEEYIKVLGEMYPEYRGTNRCSIVYDKESKLVIPVLRGATKGAGFNPVLPMETYEEKKHITDDYHVFRVEDDGVEYQVEITPVSTTKAGDGKKGEFIYKIPKVPFHIIRGIKHFFYEIGQQYDTEVLVRIWYNKEKKEYTVTLPKQSVSGSSVNEMDLVTGEGWPVIEIHSHNRFPAFFSGTDNADEQGNKIYAVIGNLHEKEGKNVKWAMRAGTMGKYVAIKPEDWIDLDSVTEENIPDIHAKADALEAQLLEQAKENLYY